jgi:hypothetical protein
LTPAAAGELDAEIFQGDFLMRDSSIASLLLLTACQSTIFAAPERRPQIGGQYRRESREHWLLWIRQ